VTAVVGAGAPLAYAFTCCIIASINITNGEDNQQSAVLTLSGSRTTVPAITGFPSMNGVMTG